MRAAHKKLEITVLTDRQKAILEFCTGGNVPAEIAKYIKVAHSSVYAELAELQRLRLLDKNEKTRPAIFVTVRSYLENQSGESAEYDTERVNVDFIKHSHNIFARAA